LISLLNSYFRAAGTQTSDPWTPVSLKEAASDASKPEVAKYITHIICSPLSRALDTAILALTDVLSDFDLLAIPELQTPGGGPNGTGRDTNTFKLKCVHGGQVLDQAESILEREMVWGDKAVRHVDFQDMKKDRNDENGKGEDGKWYAHRTSWKVRHVKGFVSGLRVANGESVIEIVAIGHGSFCRKSIEEESWDGESRDGEWEAAQCKTSLTKMGI
jgi:hypothetical protein